jgi:cyclase
MYKRIIGVVLVDNGIVCRTRNFVSDYLYTDAFIDTNFFDEIVFIDVSKNRSNETLNLFFTTIEKLMSKSQLPMAIGGGISSINDILRYREFGADRYIINQTSSASDELVKNAIEKFGKSSIISGIDHWQEFTFENGKKTETKLDERVNSVFNNSGSEILLNSAALDGSLTGFDLNVVKKISDSFKIPIIISGGVGRWTHALNALEIENVTGICTSNIYHLTTSTILSWRKQIIENGGNVREL